MTEPTEQEVERMIGMLRSPYWQQYSTVNVRAADMLESLSSRLAAERKDAERYRAIRSLSTKPYAEQEAVFTTMQKVPGMMDEGDVTPELFDAGIDAIAESTKPPKGL